MAGYGGKTEKSRKPAPRPAMPPAKLAPNPGYDRPARPAPRTEMYQPQYPAKFAARLKGGKGGGNYNANILAEKSRKYGQ